MNCSPPEEGLPLFVYGTLRTGMRHHRRFLAGRIERVVAATTAGTIHLVEDEGFPFLVPGEGVVVGELVWLRRDDHARILALIDRLEDYDPRDEPGSLYRRRRCTAVTFGGERITAWAYYWNREETPGRRLVSGDFCKGF